MCDNSYSEIFTKAIIIVSRKAFYSIFRSGERTFRSVERTFRSAEHTFPTAEHKTHTAFVKILAGLMGIIRTPHREHICIPHREHI